MGSLSLVDNRETEAHINTVKPELRFPPADLVSRFQERMIIGSRGSFEQDLHGIIEEDDIDAYMRLAAARLEVEEQQLVPFACTMLEDLVRAYHQAYPTPVLYTYYLINRSWGNSKLC